MCTFELQVHHFTLTELHWEKTGWGRCSTHLQWELFSDQSEARQLCYARWSATLASFCISFQLRVR